MKDVAGKVAFITGGASGLGLAMARSFTAAGMKVAIADIEESALAAAQEEFADINAPVITMKADVTDRDSMAKAAEDTIAAFGKVHVVCNNAGVAVFGNVAEMTYQDWDWVMKVNLDGVINGIVTFVNHIKDHGEGGHFVNTASIAGHYGMPTLSVYNASKFAVVGISESMRLDLAADNIGISVLCPGVVATNIYNSERNRPDELGGVSARPSSIGARDDGRSREEAIEESLSTALAPEVIGDMVLHAIQTDEFYILSHPSFKQPVTARSEEIAKAFDTWSAFREEHGV